MFSIRVVRLCVSHSCLAFALGIPDHVSYDGDSVVDYEILFGNLPNHHCVLATLNYRYVDPAYDDTILDRYRDPGAGAFSYNMGRTFHPKRDMEAGEEIFLDYGHCDRKANEKQAKKHGSLQWTTQVHTDHDYEVATDILFKYREKLLATASSLRGTAAAPRLEDIEIPETTDEYVREVLPRTPDELNGIFNALEGPVTKQELQVQLARRTGGMTLRTPDWIRKNGLCLHHLIPQRSHISQAGQGAFAQHALSAGDMIVPVPLLHIDDRGLLDIYEGSRNTGRKQLLLNYCIGHPESIILLCPSTNANLINHCSTRRPDLCGPNKNGPNAVFQWSKGWNPR
jgi:hypothetical protein